MMIWEHGSGREATVHGCQLTNMDLSQYWRRIFLIVHLLCITESGRGITATSPGVKMVVFLEGEVISLSSLSFNKYSSVATTIM